jgi:tetraacyldisaccharide 4'-kinase
VSGPAVAARLVEGWEHGFGQGPRLVLGALARGYRALLGTRDWLYRHGVLRAGTVGCPVVSIGNLTVGGTGKTPATELAVRTLAQLGRRPAVVSRGYRRRTRGVQVVADTASIRLEPEDAGDEPFLLARRLPGVPVIVGTNRHEAARLAVERFGATAIVLDDGFQHRTLVKDLEIVTVRTRRPWGNGQLLPHGPLREPLTALARADAVVAVGADDGDDLVEVRAAVHEHAPGVPVVGARYVPVECWEAERLRDRPLADLRGLPALAFAGIASPAAFQATLLGLGVRVVEVRRFADHHWYEAGDLQALDARAAATGAAVLVTTEKDWVRLRRLPLPARPLIVVSIRLELTCGADAWRRRFEDACAR